MSADGDRHILATSGGLVVDPRRGWLRGGLIDYALELSGAEHPRICLLGTAGGDNETATLWFRRMFDDRPEVTASHLALFPMPSVPDPRAHLLAQDVVWVGGGSVVNLLAVWRAHGLGEIMHEAWEAGVVLAGVSAGSICWHIGGTTDSYGPELRAVDNGLALLPYGNGVHYNSERQRRPLLHKLVADETLPESYATDDGAGVHYVGTEMVEAVIERAGAGAYHVVRGVDGRVKESRLRARRV